MSKCSICDKKIDSAEPGILAMGAYGTPKYLCEECSRDIEEITVGREFDSIAAAMDRVGKKMANANPDKATFNTVNSIMESSAARAKLIKEGDYDFSLDEREEESEGFDEIPEELMETEEDRALDREDEEKMKKFDKFYNWVLIGALIGVVGFVIWRILDLFVF